MIRIVVVAAALLVVAGVGAGTAGLLSMASTAAQTAARNTAVARQVVNTAGIHTTTAVEVRATSAPGGAR